MATDRLTVIDLFAGAGGFSLGFAAAGCRILAGVDRDEVAARTYARNLSRIQSDNPPVVLGGDEGDLAQIDPFTIAHGDGRPDILIGGPPCQGYSMVGRAKLDDLFEEGFRESRHADDPRNELYRRFLAAARTWKPRAILMENVPGMLSVGGVNVADRIAADIQRLGYRVRYAVLNAASYGVPQYRERLFFLGLREELGIDPTFPPCHHVSDDMPSGYFHTRLARREGQQLTLFELPGTGGPHATQLRLFEDVVPYRTVTGQAETVSRPVSVSEALDDLPPIREHLDGNPAREATRDFRFPRERRKATAHPYARLMLAWPGLEPGPLDDHVIRRTPRDYPIFARMQPGDDYLAALKIARDLFEEKIAELAKLGRAPLPDSEDWEAVRARIIPPYNEDTFRTRWQKFWPDRPSWTVPAHLSRDTYSHVHHDPTQARCISVREAARLQSFPDGFVLEGNMGDCFRQIGNAVPPLLAWHLGAWIVGLLGGEAVLPPSVQPPRAEG